MHNYYLSTKTINLKKKDTLGLNQGVTTYQVTVPEQVA
jgi:hypothetical protein